MQTAVVQKSYTLLKALSFACILAVPFASLAQAAAIAQHPVVQSSHSRRISAPPRVPKRAVTYYESLWGIDSLSVRAVESGELIRFNYRVLDPARAAQLNDKKAQPTLIDPRARASLVVPSLEKVGQLRQSETPAAGKVYWMAFSNKGRVVKRGDRVSVLIGRFHVDNLVVE